MSQLQAWLQFRDVVLQNIFGSIVSKATDCTFKIISSDREFKCHKTLLRAVSPPLNVSFLIKFVNALAWLFPLFAQDIFKDLEAQKLDDCIIVLDNVKLEEFIAFLDFAYGEKQDIAQEVLHSALTTFGIFLPHQESVSSTSTQCKSPAGVTSINQPSETTQSSNGCNKGIESVSLIGKDSDIPSSITKSTEEGQKLSREEETFPDVNRSVKKRKGSGQIRRTTCERCKLSYSIGYVNEHGCDTEEAAIPLEKESQS